MDLELLESRLRKTIDHTRFRVVPSIPVTEWVAGSVDDSEQERIDEGNIEVRDLIEVPDKIDIRIPILIFSIPNLKAKHSVKSSGQSIVFDSFIYSNQGAGTTSGFHHEAVSSLSSKTQEIAWDRLYNA